MKVSSKILTGLGIIGVIATAVTSSIATRKAIRKIEEINKELRETELYADNEKIPYNPGPLTKKEILDMTWKCYIPPLLTIGGTIGCIAGAEKVNAKTIAGATASFVALKKSYDRYGQAVKNVFGLEGEKVVKEEAVRINDKEPPEPDEIFYLGYGYDDYFKAKRSVVEMAEYIMNKKLRQGFAISVSDFMDIVGLEPNAITSSWGWSEFDQFSKMCDGWLVINLEPIDGLTDHPAFMVEFDCEPNEDFEEKHKLYFQTKGDMDPPWER